MKVVEPVAAAPLSAGAAAPAGVTVGFESPAAGADAAVAVGVVAGAPAAPGPGVSPPMEAMGALFALDATLAAVTPADWPATELADEEGIQDELPLKLLLLATLLDGAMPAADMLALELPLTLLAPGEPEDALPVGIQILVELPELACAAVAMLDEPVPVV